MSEKVYAIWDIGQEPGGAEETPKKAGKEGETVPGGNAVIGGGIKTAKITFLAAENKADMQKAVRELYGARTKVLYVKEANLEE